MKSKYTIRKRRKTRHPQIIVDVDRTRFKSVTLTHNERNLHNLNIKLPDNPDPNDTRDSYFTKRFISDFKFH